MLPQELRANALGAVAWMLQSASQSNWIHAKMPVLPELRKNRGMEQPMLLGYMHTDMEKSKLDTVSGHHISY